MAHHRMHQSITKLAVTVTERQMRVYIDDWPDPLVTPFTIPDEAIDEIERDYSELHGLSYPQQGATDEAYKELEGVLGRRLARLLLSTVGPPPEHTLGMILHRSFPEDPGRYVRLMLNFEHEAHAALPWELTLWQRPGTQEEIHIGKDPRIAVTRFHPHIGTPPRQLWGADGVLSILHIGADDSNDGPSHYEFISKFLGVLDEHIPRLHTTSRWFYELKQFYECSIAFNGQLPEFDIVHWRGHGDSKGVKVPTGTPGDYVSLTPAQVVQHTQRAFLYVMLTCESGSGKRLQQSYVQRLDDVSKFSSGLLAAGAPVVLGIYEAVGQEEFDHLPILYRRLFRGLPLDYGVQELRRFFAQRNVARAPLPRAGWQKLILHTTSDQFLDGPRAIIQASHQGQCLAAEVDTYRSVLSLFDHARGRLTRNP